MLSQYKTQCLQTWLLALLHLHRTCNNTSWNCANSWQVVYIFFGYSISPGITTNGSLEVPHNEVRLYAYFLAQLLTTIFLIGNSKNIWYHASSRSTKKFHNFFQIIFKEIPRFQWIIILKNISWITIRRRRKRRWRTRICEG